MNRVLLVTSVAAVHPEKTLMTRPININSSNKSMKSLTGDMSNYVEYCRDWRLVPNPTKTEVSCSHLNDQCVNEKLRVMFDENILNHETLNQCILESSSTCRSRSKNTQRINLLKKLTGTKCHWGATAKCLRTSALALVYSTAENCCSSWSNSSHAKKMFNSTEQCE